MQNEISSLELTFLTKELQCLLDSRIDKVFMNDNKDMFLQMHKASLGKIILRVSVPHYLYMTTSKPSFDTPSNFCMALRKRINNARIREISQVPNERILKIVLETKESTYSLYFESFLKGNIILVDGDGKIDLLAQNQSWAERTIRAKQEYVFPERKVATLVETLPNKLVKYLAADMNFGGEFAEEICFRAGVDKTAKAISKKEITQLEKAIKEITAEQPKGYIYTNTKSTRIFPIEMKSVQDCTVKQFDTFSQALNEVFTTVMEDEKISKREGVFQQKVNKFQVIYDAQKEALQRNENIITDSTKKGDAIYSHFQEITQILEQLKVARETMAWKEIKAKLKGHKIIKSINEKKGTLVVELS